MLKSNAETMNISKILLNKALKFESQMLNVEIKFWPLNTGMLNIECDEINVEY